MAIKTLQQLKDGLGKMSDLLFRLPGKVLDPRNVDSDLRPEDLDLEDDFEPSEEEEALVQLVMSRFKSSSEARQIHEREWLVCQAFRMGNQWVEWRADTLRDMRDPNDPFRSYVTDDQIDRLLRKLKTRATTSKPDASVKPLTPAEIDMLAADEARDVIAHYDQKFNRQQQTLEWVDSVLSTSTTWLKVLWDESLEVLGPSDRGVAVHQRVGDIDEIVIPPFEVFPDTAARHWSEVTWLIHAKDRPLSYIQSKYGKRGYRVKGNIFRGDNAAYNYAEQRQDLISGDSISTAHTGERTAVVYECWELPSPRYPLGRLIRVAGGCLLTEPDTTEADEYDEWLKENPDSGARDLPRKSVDWPYVKRDTFPFVPLGYEIRPRGLWSLNPTARLIPLQRAVNSTESRIQDCIENFKVIIVEDRGAETGPDAYSSPRSLYRIQKQKGFDVQVFEPQSMNAIAAMMAHKHDLIVDMENIAGVHEVSNGTVPTGVTAGNAIELLMQSDQTQMAEFVTCIETAQKIRAEWEVALVAQFYDEPRLVAVSTLPATPPTTNQVPQSLIPQFQPQGMQAQPPPGGGPDMPPGAAPVPAAPPPPPSGGPNGQRPATPQMAVRAFEALTKGGQVKIEVVPGSATPKTPAARLQMYMDLAAHGFFDPPKLPVLKVMADLMGVERSDTFTDRIDQAYAEVQAQQPPPQVMEKMKSDAAANAQNLQLTGASQLEAIKVHGDIEKMTTEYNLKAQMRAADMAHELDLKTQDHHHEVAMAHAQSVTPTAAFQVKLPIAEGGSAAQSAQEMIGLTPDTADDIANAHKASQADAAASKPAPAAPSKGKAQD